MSPGLPHTLEGAVLQAQLEKESQQDAVAAAALSKKAENWSGNLKAQASGADSSAYPISTMGEDGVQRPCCAYVRPLQLR